MIHFSILAVVQYFSILKTNMIYFFLSPSPSSCTVIKFTLSSIYLEINLIPTEKRGCAFALYLPLSFIHLIPPCNSFCLYQFKNPPKLLKKCPPQNVLFKKTHFCDVPGHSLFFPKQRTQFQELNQHDDKANTNSFLFYTVRKASITLTGWDVNSPPPWETNDKDRAWDRRQTVFQWDIQKRHNVAFQAHTNILLNLNLSR